MASIYRRTRSYQIPAGAEITERTRKAAAAELQLDPQATSVVERRAIWTDGRGRRRRGTLNASGDRVMVESGSYLISYWDADDKRQEINSGTTDRDAAEQIARKLESDVALRKLGVIDTAQERLSQEGRRPLHEQIDAYQATLEAAGRDGKHVASTMKYIKTVTKGLEMATEITADAVATYAADLQTKGKSARTIQAVMTAAKSFTRWLANHGKLPSDPLARLSKPNPRQDRRRVRRFLLPDEWEWLRTTTEAAPFRYNMLGKERMLVYATAIQTGLRASELASLTRGRLFLDPEQPYLTALAKSTKNRKDARLYLRPDLAELLKTHIATKASGAKVFAMPHISNAARMLHEDMEAARQAWLEAAQGAEERARREESDFLSTTNHEGDELDFHGLRHTSGAWLAMSGVHPKVVQTVLRHSTITLTMDTYGHLFPGHEADAVTKLPAMFSSAQKEPAATGIDDAKEVTSTKLPADRQQWSGGTGRDVAEHGGSQSPRNDEAVCPNVLPMSTLDDKRQDVAASDKSAPHWTRTNNPLIKSQMLCQLS